MKLFKKKTLKEKEFYNKVLNDNTGGYNYIEWLFFNRFYLYSFFIFMIILTIYGLIYWNKELIVFCPGSILLGILLSLSEYYKLKKGERDYF
jgi:hypothetical protein